MSRKLAALVYSRRVGSAVRKSVLAYMAECAGEDGKGVWASKQTIANAAEVGRSSVIKACNEFLEEGLIQVTGSQKCANGATTEYRLVIAKIEALPQHEKGRKGSTSGTSHQRDQSTPETPLVHPVDPKGSTSGTQTVSKPSLKEDTIVSSARATPSKKKRATQICPDAQITEGMLKAAAKRGHGAIEAEAQFRRFKDNAMAKGRTYVDWDAAYRNWLTSPYFRPITVIPGDQNDRPPSKSRRTMDAFTAGARGPC